MEDVRVCAASALAGIAAAALWAPAFGAEAPDISGLSLIHI